MPTLPKIKKKTATYATIAVMAGAAIVSSVPAGVRECDISACRGMSGAEYQQMRERIAGKIQANLPLTGDEYEIAVAILDKRFAGGVDLGAVHSDEDVQEAIIKTIYAE